VSQWEELKADLNAADDLASAVAIGAAEVRQKAEALQQTFGRISPQLSNSLLVGAAAVQIDLVVALAQQLHQAGTDARWP